MMTPVVSHEPLPDLDEAMPLLDGLPFGRVVGVMAFLLDNHPGLAHNSDAFLRIVCLTGGMLRDIPDTFYGIIETYGMPDGEPPGEQVRGGMNRFDTLPESLRAQLRPYIERISLNWGREKALLWVVSNIKIYAPTGPQARRPPRCSLAMRNHWMPKRWNTSGPRWRPKSGATWKASFKKCHLSAAQATASTTTTPP